ncbi:MAG: PorT family protein [Alistipes putredinis]|nr:MAG: PorT family protein [Alistipes putredinis]
MQKRFEWGVKGGINTSGITNKSQTAFTQRFEGIGIYDVKNTNKGVGWQVGAFGRVNFSEFNLQLEVLYSNSRSINTMMTLSDNPDAAITNAVTFHNIDIPLELGFKFSIFRIYFWSAVFDSSPFKR